MLHMQADCVVLEACCLYTLCAARSLFDSASFTGCWLSAEEALFAFSTVMAMVDSFSAFFDISNTPLRYGIIFARGSIRRSFASRHKSLAVVDSMAVSSFYPLVAVLQTQDGSVDDYYGSLLAKFMPKTTGLHLVQLVVTDICRD